MAFVRLSRLHFLLGGVLMYAVGVASGVGIGLGDYLIGQALVSAAQVTAHYVNEFADFEADRLVENRTLFSGGSGVLVSGRLRPRVALVAAATSTLLAVVLAVVVAFRSPIAAVLGIAALAVSWFYSMPPIRLLGTGLGEIATSVVVVVVVPLIGLELAGGGLHAAFWWLVTALFAAHLAMMLAFELPDLHSDRAAGKNVIAVRIGARATLGIMSGLVTTSAVVVAAGIGFGALPAFTLWGVVSTLIGGGIMTWAASAERFQVATIAAVANLSALGGVGLLAMDRVT